MKYTLIILLIISLNCSAQLSNTLPNGNYNWAKSKGAGLAMGVAITGFAANETIIRTAYFNNKTVAQKDRTTLSIFGTTAILSVGTAILYPILHKKIKRNKRKKRNFTYKF